MAMMIEFKRIALGDNQLSPLFYVNWNGQDQLITMTDDYKEGFHPLVRFDLNKNSEHRIVLSKDEVIVIVVNRDGHIFKASATSASGVECEFTKFLVPADNPIMRYVTIPIRMETLLKAPGKSISL